MNKKRILGFVGLFSILLVVAIGYRQLSISSLKQDLADITSELEHANKTLEKQRQDNLNLTTTNANLSQRLEVLSARPTQFHPKKPKLDQYRDMQLSLLKGSIYQAPFDYASSIDTSGLNCFILGHVVNEVNQEWVYIEVLNPPDPNFKYVYTKPTSLYEDAKLNQPLGMDSIQVNSITFFDTLDTLQAKLGEDLQPIITEEDLSILADTIHVLIHPQTLIVEGILLREDGQSFDGVIHVGDNAFDGIKYYSSMYPPYYNEDTFIEEPMNWYALSDDGLVLVLDYDSSKRLENSRLTEIKIIKMLDR